MSDFGHLGDREFDPERRSLADFAVDSQRAADRFDEALGERESEPGAFDARRLGVQSVKGGEESFAQVGTDARTGVGDRESDHAALSTRTSMVTVPFGRLYLIALDKRLSRTCFSRCWSPSTWKS